MSLLSPGSSEHRHGAEVGHRGGHQRYCCHLGAAVASSGDDCVADDRQVQPGTGGEPWPSGSAAEEAGNQSEVSQAHKPCGPWVGEAHERSDTGWRRGKNATDGRREHTDPDRCSLCIVGHHAVYVKCSASLELRTKQHSAFRRVNRAGCYLPVRSRCLHPGQQQGRRRPSSSSS
jgi:hypothetical protein